MGFLLGAAFRRRWFTLAGFVIVVASLFLPANSTARSVVAVTGLVVILVQIPLALRAERRRREEPPTTH
jgi:hypothetical protein